MLIRPDELPGEAVAARAKPLAQISCIRPLVFSLCVSLCLSLSLCLKQLSLPFFRLIQALL